MIPRPKLAQKSVLEQFRAKPIRQKLHPTESALLWLVCAHLVFLPWALGGMKGWSQWIALSLSVCAFVVAVRPRTYVDREAGQAPFRLYPWPKLVRFPIFWLGLLVLAYIATGALNPAWIFQSNGRSWWMLAVPYNEWLPSGVTVPFDYYGPWRMIVIYASLWLTVCATWVGFTRRRALQTLFTVLASNAFLLAILGIVQRALNADKMFFLWRPPANYFVSSFIYKNHAGAYFVLLLSVCAGLALWHYQRAERRLDKSSPSGLFAFFGTAVAMIVFFSYSRMATILMAAYLVVMFCLFLWRHFFRASEEKRRPWIVILLAIALVAFARIGLVSLRTETFMQRMSELQHQYLESGDSSRGVAAAATWEMAQDRLWLGWGAGSFRTIFPRYQQHHASIYKQDGLRLYWEHAHNDYLELLAELGIAGVALLALGAVYAAFQTLRVHAWQNAFGLCVLLGLGLTLIHCVVDFNFYNPAILTTWCVLLFGVIRWVELEEQAIAG